MDKKQVLLKNQFLRPSGVSEPHTLPYDNPAHDNHANDAGSRNTVIVGSMDVKDYAEYDRPERPNCWTRFREYWRQEGAKLVIVCIIIGVGIALFLERFLFYTLGTTPRGTAAFGVFGYGLSFARGAANALKFWIALMPLLACRWLISIVSNARVIRKLPLHKFTAVFHSHLVAICLCVGTAIHVGAHVANAINIEGVALLRLQAFWPNAAVHTAASFVFTTRTGITGLCATVVMIVMMVLALLPVRRRNFELFQWSHIIGTLLFFGVLMGHGSNIFETPVMWMWAVGPLAVYLLDRIVRWSITYPTEVVVATLLGENAVHLQLRLPDRFKYQPGSYVRLAMAEKYPLQYHPFTISSANEAGDILGLHIGNRGNWTSSFIANVQPGLRMRVQGPFNSATVGCLWDYQEVLLVGGGLGATPFFGILKAIASRLRTLHTGDGFSGGGDILALRYCEFVWVCRDKHQFEWIAQEMMELQTPATAPFLRISTFFSRGEDDDKFNPLISRVGRPEWEPVFNRLREKAGRRVVGVYVSGPRALQKQLYTETTQRPKFVIKKEVF